MSLYQYDLSTVVSVRDVLTIDVIHCVAKKYTTQPSILVNAYGGKTGMV